jgi:GNAT superfamily N-acetyltransferase
VSEGAPVAAGIGVLVDDWLGVFEVVVDPSQRRRGHGRVLLEALHAWAAERAVTRSFLQVVVENRAAVALDKHLGYEEAYRYWYRRDPG